jgi:hypothetical protein
LNLSVLLLGAVWGTTYLKFVNPDLSEATFTGIVGMIFIGTMIGSPICGWLSATRCLATQPECTSGTCPTIH